MGDSRIYESLVIINKRIEGLLARVDYAANEAANTKSDLHIFERITTDSKMKNVLKDQKLFTDHFPYHKRESMKSFLKPYVDTLLQMAELPDQVKELLKKIEEKNLVLDLNINLTLSQQFLKMVSNCTALFIVFSGYKELHIIPETYRRLISQSDEELQNLEKFMKQYGDHPVERLSVCFFAHQTLLAEAAFSATKILERGTGQLQHHLNTLFTDLTTPQEKHNENSGVRDTLNCYQVARWAYLTFIVAGMPWDLSNKEDRGGRLMAAILSSGWLVNLWRDRCLNYHDSTSTLVKRAKDKQAGKKISKIKDWEREAHNMASDPAGSKKRRKMLVMLLEEYSKIFEDQPMLIGPKMVLILTLLSQASSEINWIVIHQNDPDPPKNKSVIAGLSADIETIQILFYMDKIRNLIRDGNNRELLYTYLVLSLKEADLKDSEAKLMEMDASTEDLRSLIENIQSLELIDGSGGKEVETKIDPCDLGRLITELSVRSHQTSSPMQKDANLAHQLELASLHVQMMEDADKIFRRTADLTFLYFFSETFMDYFNHCFTFIERSLPNHLPSSSYQIIFNFSHLIAFPSICQDFTDCLHSMCPEEFEEVIKKSRDIANLFLQNTAEKTTQFMEKHNWNMINQTMKIQPRTMASKFDSKYNKNEDNQDGRDQQEYEEEKTRRPTGSNLYLSMKNNLARKYLFETKVENNWIVMRELSQVFFQYPSIKIGNYTLIPENYLLDFITDKIRERIRSFIYFDASNSDVYSLLPSQVLLKVNSYCQSLINIDPGLDLVTIIQETLYDFRASEDIVHQSFMTKYMAKLFQLISTPHCYYNKSLACFVQLNTNMEYKVDWAELFTSSVEFQALSELMGTEGIIWFTTQIRKDITASIGRLVDIVNTNKILLNQKQSTEEILKQLDKVPNFILSCIDVGKKLGLLSLVMEAHSDLINQRAPYLQSLMDLMITPETIGFIPFQISDSTATIAEALGLRCSPAVQLDIETSSSQLILDMMECLLPLLANLTSSRYYQASLNTDPIDLDCHKNSINCLGETIKMIIKEDRGMLDFKRFIKQALDLPLGSHKNMVGALILGLSIVSAARGDRGELQTRQEEGLPFPLYQGATIRCSLDSRHPHTDTLAQELQSRKIAKMMKKSKSK